MDAVFTIALATLAVLLLTWLGYRLTRRLGGDPRIPERDNLDQGEIHFRGPKAG
jgi:hypothetical protein